MTGRDVVEATRRLRPAAAVMYVSGHSGDVLARVGGDAAAPFLQKPFSATELHAAVRRALEQAGRFRS
jgi:FixJ family two-component response regulator